MFSIQSISPLFQTSDVDTFHFLEDILLVYSLIHLHYPPEIQLDCIIPEILKNFGIPVKIIDGSKLVKQINKFTRIITVKQFKFSSSGQDAIRHAGTQMSNFIECLANFVDLFEQGKNN